MPVSAFISMPLGAVVVPGAIFVFVLQFGYGVPFALFVLIGVCVVVVPVPLGFVDVAGVPGVVWLVL